MRYFLEITYDGTNFHGWQFQPNAITVQEVLTKAVNVFVKDKELSLVGCGRTDRGVHASQFFVHFDSDVELDISNFIYKANKILPYEISIKKCFKVHDIAHARFDATSRTYQYFIHQDKNPFKQRFSLYYERELDLDKMNEASKLILNYKDFTSFARLHADTHTNDCNIYHAFLIKKEDGVIFEIKANRFLRNMVRSIVGTLLDVGTGKTSIEEFIKIIEAKDRNKAGDSVDGRGLFLTKVEYPFIYE